MPRDERALEAGLTDGDVPQALAEGEIEIVGLLPRATNYTFFAHASDGAERLAVVYKPRRGETPLWDFPEGTLCQREVAAYQVARILGWPNIPPTVLRGGPEGPGSVQLFVPSDPNAHYFTLEKSHADEFRKVALFDLVVNNADRKGGHCLLGHDGRIWVVDHGVCFSPEPKLRTVIWEFAGEPVPPALRDDLRQLRDALRAGAPETTLEDLLSPEELGALRDRIDVLIAAAAFPEPGPGRPFPWPPV